MAGRYIDAKAATITGGTTTGYITLASITGWYKNAIVWLNAPATSDAVGTADGVLVTFTATLTALPINPNTVVIKDNAVVVGRDNGQGAITGAGITSGSINYTTGALSVTFTVAPVNTHAITAEHSLIARRGVITELVSGSNQLGICFRTTDPGSSPSYGRSNVAAYNGGTVNQDEQLIYNVNDKPLD